MSKIKEEDVEIALRQAKVSPEEKVNEVLKLIHDQIEAEKLEKEKKVRAKSKTLILASVKGEGQDIRETPCFIFQVPEEFDHNALESTVQLAIQDFKATGKKKAGKINSLGDGILYCPSKFFKARNITRKSKEPILVQTTNNELRGQIAPTSFNATEG